MDHVQNLLMKFKDRMSISSYDELIKHVESLKLENSHLKQELQDNSSHLTKLENEASNMKDVLAHLHSAMEHDLDRTLTLDDLLTYSNDNLDHNSNNPNEETQSDTDIRLAHTANQLHDQGGVTPINTAAVLAPFAPGIQGGAHKSQNNSPTGSPSKKRTLERECYSYIQELDQERNSILSEVEGDERHRKWYYDQLEALNDKIDSLPLTEPYNLQTDMTRRQLEYEVQRVRDLMHENLGSTEHITQRHEARLQRIRIIEAEMVRLQQCHREQLEQEKRDSGTCDHNEADRDGLVVMDASTNTVDMGETNINMCEDGGHTNPHNLSTIFHGAWPIEKGFGGAGDSSLTGLGNPETASVMSFNSSNASSGPRRVSNQQLGTKVEMVYSLLSMLGTHDKDDMSRTLLAMSSSQDSCIAMRQSGCLPLLIQLLHGSDKDSGLLGNVRGSKAARARAAAALHNIVHSHPDDKRGRREARVLRLLEQIRAHCDKLRDSADEDEEERGKWAAAFAAMVAAGSRSSDIDHHPGPAIAALMKLSFDEEHRHAICTLGGLQAIAELLQVDHEAFPNTMEQYNITMRRYACMALTNLTFGDGTNKALLCSMKSAMQSLVAQLNSPNEDLRQVAASVLRNLSWRADLASKKTLREVGAVVALMKASLEVKKESTLKSILSALWNLSAHCSENKADICAVEGALAYLITTLTYKSPTKTLAIIENGGGILRNVSSHIAVREEYRQILRHHGCLQILLKHLRSPSLTIVSNACGTLWNLSARCPEDQQALWDMGAVSMLRNLVHSKHKMISMGSSAALKNLLAARPNMMFLDSDKNSKSNMPTLQIRKQRALEAEIDQNLAETCDNVESPHGSPTEYRKNNAQPHVNGPKYIFSTDNNGSVYQLTNNDHRRPLLRNYLQPKSSSGDSSPLLQSKVHSPQRSVSRSGSQDSVGSVHSDISHDRSRIHSMLTKSSRLLERPIYSTEKQRDHVMHRFNNADSLRSGNVPPNSRIMQVMQEVLQVGLDPKAQESHSAENTPQMHRQPQTGSNRTEPGRRIPVLSQRHMFRGGVTEMSSASDSHSFSRHPNTDGLNNVHSQQQSDNSNLPFNLQQRMENLHVNQDDEECGDSQDQPINYSLKYSAEPSAINNHNNLQNASSMSSRPVPKVGNYMTGLSFSGQQKVSNLPQRVNNYDRKDSNVTATNRTDTKVSENIDPESVPFTEVTQYSGYAETDLDNMDQPTNYSIRYAEQVDDNIYTDQPINYSTRFQEPESNCHDCRLEDARRTNEILEHTMMTVNDDSVKTFCTEGTPLTFLSTATSMTDLSGKANDKNSKSSENEGSGDSHSNDKIHNFSKDEDPLGSSISSSHSDSDKPVDTTVLEMDKVNDNVTTPKPVSAVAINNNNTIQQRSSGQSSMRGSVTSYNNSSHHSPSCSEKPTTYCEEGTPVCFSRVSSLSSLHSGMIDEQEQQQQQPRSVLKNMPTDKNGVSYQRYMQGGLSDSPQSQSTEGGNTSHGKTVTFDQQSHVEETPLMFSRCSSLGSLSSFDAHSVHSSVVSEYSRRASEVVSPSDLPDSPSETMPSSPKTSKSPNKFEPIHTPKQQSIQSHPESASNTNSKTVVPSSVIMGNQTQDGTQSVPVLLPDPALEFKDSPVAYAIEGSPDNFSCATSLSALTIDDEPKVNIDPILKSAAKVGKNNEDSNGKQQLVRCSPVPSLQRKIEPAIPEEESGHSSVSEGEEDMLLQCISSAMPSKSAKKMKKSASDNAIKKKSIPVPKMSSFSNYSKVTSASTPKQNQGSSSTRLTGITTPGNCTLSAQHRLPTFPPSTNNSNDYIGSIQDTMKSFATEGTPLNFSTATSLSDLSCISPPSEPQKPDIQEKTASDNSVKKAKLDVIDADISDSSSLCDDTENLLSEAIQMAMPKKSSSKPNRHSSPMMDRTAEGCDTKDKHRFQSPASTLSVNQGSSGNSNKETQFKKPLAMWKFQPERTSSHNSNKVSVSSDTMRTYETEGTPINFSTATSLSDLTIDSLEDREQGVGRSAPTTADDSPQHSPMDQNSNVATYGNSHDDSVFARTQSFDSPLVFGVEGTPITFSRNDSLSSLSCDEDNEQENKEKTKAKALSKGCLTPPSRKSSGLLSPKGKNTKTDAKSGIPSPRVKALAMSGKSYGYSSTKHHIAPKIASNSGSSELSRSLDDQPQMYAVEGTPMCFSRNSSLSSLNSDDHEGLANQGASADATLENTVLEENHASFKVEGTPVCFSRDSPLSALSVESLSSDYEPTPSEKAMLEECINMAMPKRKTQKSLEKSINNKVKKAPCTDSSGLEKGASSKVAKNSPNVSPKDESKHDKPPDRGGDRRTELDERRKHKPTHPKNVLSKAGDRSQPKTNVPLLQSVREESTDLPDAEQNLYSSSLDEATIADASELQDSCSSETPMNVKRGKDESNHEKSASSHNSFSVDDANFSPTTDSDLYEAMQCGYYPPEENLEIEVRSDNRTDDNKLQDEVQIDSESLQYDRSLIQVAAQSLVTSENLVSAETVNDMSSLTADYDDSEKVDSTKSERSDLDTEIENDINLSFESGIKRLDNSDSEYDIADITKETFPEMSYSLDTLSTPEDENLPELKESDIEILDVLECVPELEQNSSPDWDDKDAFSSPEKASSMGEQQNSLPEMSPEMERALEENANIVLSELSFKRELSSSTLDEDISLIENETISLVSNDYMSDTASEISISLSNSSKTISEQTEVSSSTLSCTSSALSQNRPRIVKPINKYAVKLQKEKEGPKPIRGGKKKSSVQSLSSFSSGRSVKSSDSTKPIKGGISPIKTVTTVKNASQKTTPSKRTPSKISSVNKGLGAKVASPISANKIGSQSSTSSKCGNQKIMKQNQSAAQNSTSQTVISKVINCSKPASPKSSPKPVRNTRFSIATKNTLSSKANIPNKTTASSKANSPTSKSQNSSNLPKSTSVSPSQKSGMSKSKLPMGNNSTVSKTLLQDDEIERPKPPIKQGTFTKESPSASAPPIVGHVDDPDSEVGSICDLVNDKVFVNGGHVRLREKRKSGGSTPPQRQSDLSMSPLHTSGGTPPQRNSGSSQDSTWSKALESFQFVVDRSADANVPVIEETKKKKVPTATLR